MYECAPALIPEESYGAPHSNLIEDSYGSPHSEPIHTGWQKLELSGDQHKLLFYGTYSHKDACTYDVCNSCGNRVIPLTDQQWSREVSTAVHTSFQTSYVSALRYKLIEVESIYGCMHPKDSYGAPHGNVIHEDSYGPPHAEPIHKGGPILRLSLHEKKSINT